jgi:molybdenum ABC transporter molybdate-binding protein
MSLRLFCLCALLLLAGCPHPQSVATSAVPDKAPAAGPPISIWADPALRGALEALEPLYRERFAGGWKVTYVERAALLELARRRDSESGTLSTGSRPAPDVLLTPDAAVYHELRRAGVIDESTARTFAGDVLLVVHRKEEGWPLPRFQDLPLLRFKTLGLGSTDTSLGFYTQQAIVTDGLVEPLKDRTKEYATTQELLTALGSGELDLAIVYGSTAAQSTAMESAAAVPEDLHEDIRYQAVAVTGRAGRPGAVELLRLLSEDPQAQEVLGSFGYMDRTAALQENR